MSATPVIGGSAADETVARGVDRATTSSELRELVRYRAKIVAIRSGLKAQVHAVLAKAGVLIAASDLFGVEAANGSRRRLWPVRTRSGWARCCI